MLKMPDFGIQSLPGGASPASAFKHSIVRNLFMSDPLYENVLGSSLDFIENCRATLKVAFGRGGIAPQLGCTPVENSKVLDVGTRDGRYVSVFSALGASTVYGIDPDEIALEAGILDGNLDRSKTIF